MDQLWAPWRMQYIENVDKENEGCIFCTKPQQHDDKKNLILHRGINCFVIMNLYPYNNGHLMIVPYKHTSDMATLDEQTGLEIWKTVSRCKTALSNIMGPDGFNVGMNLGRVAGAGIDQHLHVHIVPRWNGDTNFMPAIGQTKVISQSLYDTYDCLFKEFN